MTIEIRETAVDDLADARWFYESQGGRALGEYLMNSLISDIDSLSLHAGIHPKKGRYFRMLSRRFPHAIYYTLEGDRVEVWRVLDCLRDPKRTDRELDGGMSD